MLDDEAKSKAETAYTVCLIVGLVTVGNAALNCFVICNHPEFQAMNAPDAAGSAQAAGGDPSRMSDEQIRAYLAAHPELAAQVAGSNKGGMTGDVVTVPIGDDGGAPAAAVAPDWASGGAGGGKPAKASGGGFFGFGKKNGGGGGGAASSAPKEGSDTYHPPSIPVAVPVAAAADSSNPYAVPAMHTAAVPPSAGYAPPAAHTRGHPAAAAHAPAPAAAAAAPAAGQQQFAITGEEDDNPFAQGDNPFGR
jgi:hypothetical protein